MLYPVQISNILNYKRKYCTCWQLLFSLHSWQILFILCLYLSSIFIKSCCNIISFNFSKKTVYSWALRVPRDCKCAGWDFSSSKNTCQLLQEALYFQSVVASSLLLQVSNSEVKLNHIERCKAWLLTKTTKRKPCCQVSNTINSQLWLLYTVL